MATVLGQVNLNGCNYQLAYDLLGQDTAGNYSTVRFYGVLNVTNGYISWSRGSCYAHNSSTDIGTYYTRGSYTLITADYTFYHDENGYFSQWIGGGLNTTFTSGDTGGQLELPRINRIAVTNSASGSILEENFSVNYTKFTNNFSYQLRISVPEVTEIQKIIGYTSEANFKLNNEALNYLYNYAKNSNTVRLGFAVETWNGNSIISSGNEVIISGKIVNANPIFVDFDFEDINSKTVTLTGNNKSIISGYSNIKATITVDDKAMPLKSATMSKYRLTVGENNSTDISYSTENNVSGVVNNVTNSTVNVYAIDSRNNSTLVSKQAINFYPYNQLIKNNITVNRSNGGVGENVTLTYSGTIDLKDFGQVVNSIKKATYTLQRTDSSEIIIGKTNIMPTVDENGKFTFTGLITGDTEEQGFDIGSSYIITVTVSDELSSAVFTATISAGKPNIALYKNGTAIGQFYDEKAGGSVQLADDTLVNVKEKIGTQELICDAYYYGSPNDDAVQLQYGIQWTNLVTHASKNITYIASLDKYDRAYFHFEKDGLYAVVVRLLWNPGGKRTFCDLDIKNNDTGMASARYRTTDTQDNGAGESSTMNTFIMPLKKGTDVTLWLYAADPAVFKAGSFIQIYKIGNLPR